MRVEVQVGNTTIRRGSGRHIDRLTTLPVVFDLSKLNGSRATFVLGVEQQDGIQVSTIRAQNKSLAPLTNRIDTKLPGDFVNNFSNDF